jgi:hypothetical protein
MEYNPMCACLSIRELASITESRIFAMLIRAYVDDSADETQERAVVAGAYVGFFGQWNRLQEKWRKRLKREGIDYFHATEYYSFQGLFAKFKDPVRYPKPKGSEAAKALLSDLETIISKSGIMGIAVCVDMKAYTDIRETEPGAKGIFPADAFEAALQALMLITAKIVRDEWTDATRKVAFVCDQGNTAPRITKVYADFVEKNSGLSPHLGGLVHQDDKKLSALQTADMMAHLAKGRFIEWLDDPHKATFTHNEILKDRLKKLSVHQIAVWNREYMLEVLRTELESRTAAQGV